MGLGLVYRVSFGCIPEEAGSKPVSSSEKESAGSAERVFAMYSQVE